MAVHLYEWRAAFDCGRTKTKIISQTRRYAAQVENPVLMRELAVNRVDVMLVTFAGQSSKFGVAEQEGKRQPGGERKQQSSEGSQPIFAGDAKHQNHRNQKKRRAKSRAREQGCCGAERES